MLQVIEALDVSLIVAARTFAKSFMSIASGWSSVSGSHKDSSSPKSRSFLNAVSISSWVCQL